MIELENLASAHAVVFRGECQLGATVEVTSALLECVGSSITLGTTQDQRVPWAIAWMRIQLSILEAHLGCEKECKKEMLKHLEEESKNIDSAIGDPLFV